MIWWLQVHGIWMLIKLQLRDINLEEFKTTSCTSFGRTSVARSHSHTLVIPPFFASAFGIDSIAQSLDHPFLRRMLFREPMTPVQNIGVSGRAVFSSFLGCFFQEH